VLFDRGTPAPLREALNEHQVSTAFEQGWSKLQNGALIAAAEKELFEVFVTTDKNLKYQQNLASRRHAVAVLLTMSWPKIRLRLPVVVAAIDQALPGNYREVNVKVFPDQARRPRP